MCLQAGICSNKHTEGKRSKLKVYFKSFFFLNKIVLKPQFYLDNLIVSRAKYDFQVKPGVFTDDN